MSHGAEVMHFLGEVEVVFGLWAIALMIAIIAFYDWSTAVHYLGETVNFTEPAFVVVIMTLAATRPILRLAEGIIGKIAGMLGGSLSARCFTTLTVGPLLGSFITEPAAMTISALLLARTVYALEPSSRLKYGTLGLLLVNVSVGGTLTHFAAPPVLMVAAPWGWDMSHMLWLSAGKRPPVSLYPTGSTSPCFVASCQRSEGKYAVVRLKEEIQTSYLKREDMDARFDEAQAKHQLEHGCARPDRRGDSARHRSDPDATRGTVRSRVAGERYRRGAHSRSVLAAVRGDPVAGNATPGAGLLPASESRDVRRSRLGQAR